MSTAAEDLYYKVKREIDKLPLMTLLDDESIAQELRVWQNVRRLMNEALPSSQMVRQPAVTGCTAGSNPASAAFAAVRFDPAKHHPYSDAFAELWKRKRDEWLAKEKL